MSGVTGPVWGRVLETALQEAMVTQADESTPGAATEAAGAVAARGDVAAGAASAYTVVIPAYKPGAALGALVVQLVGAGVPAIVVVDDGGGPTYAEIFRAVAKLPRVTVLHHATNLGKGAALKTGMNHAAYHFPGNVGVVTADADGQHLPADIVRVGEELARNPGALVMGCRQFAGEVPLRSKVGNIATRYLMRWVGGLDITDTQTGLRGVPTGLVPKLLRLQTGGYEFELDMLMVARQRGVAVREVPIETVYLDGNASSHFNPLVDSMRIYFVLLRFAAASVVTAVIDYAVFAVVYRAGHNVLLAQGLARLVAMCFNYAAIKRAVFYSDQKHSVVLPKYVALVVLSGLVSYALIHLLLAYVVGSVFEAKVLAEGIVFFANFAVAREFIFSRPGDVPVEGAGEA